MEPRGPVEPNELDEPESVEQADPQDLMMHPESQETEETDDSMEAVETQEGSIQDNEGRSFKGIYLLAIILLLLIGGALILLQYLPREKELVATVNGEEITREELYEAMLASTGRDVLDRLIMNILIKQEGEKRGILVGEEEISAELQRVIDESFYGMEELFNQAISDYGISEDEVREELKAELILRRIAESELDLQEEDEREYFAANRNYFDVTEKVEARHILLETEEEAERIRQMLIDGDDFAELAGEYSKDQTSAVQGGSLGFFERGRMVPEFEEVAFSLRQGEISDVVETQFGYHIIEVLERQEAREVTFEEVRDQVSEQLKRESISGKMGEQLEMLWQKADVDYRI